MPWHRLFNTNSQRNDNAKHTERPWGEKFPNLARHTRTSRSHPAYENMTDAIIDGKAVIQGEDSILAFVIWEDGGKFKLFFREQKHHETSDEALHRIRVGAKKTPHPIDLHFWTSKIKSEPEQSTFLKQTSMHRYFTRSRPHSITSV
tara:strand:- start:113 stop:553 length:441 start_codon:yes stop_codon:yes gene_type:complete